MYPMPDHIDSAATLESLMTFSDGLTCLLYSRDCDWFFTHLTAEDTLQAYIEPKAKPLLPARVSCGPASLFLRARSVPLTASLV